MQPTKVTFLSQTTTPSSIMTSCGSGRGHGGLGPERAACRKKLKAARASPDCLPHFPTAGVTSADAVTRQRHPDTFLGRAMPRKRLRRLAGASAY